MSGGDLLQRIRVRFRQAREHSFNYQEDPKGDQPTLTTEESFVISNFLHLHKHWMVDHIGPDHIMLHHPSLHTVLLQARSSAALWGYYLGYLRASGYEADTEELVCGTGCPEEDTLDSFRQHVEAFDQASDEPPGDTIKAD